MLSVNLLVIIIIILKLVHIVKSYIILKYHFQLDLIILTRYRLIVALRMDN